MYMSKHTSTPWTISEIGFYGEFDIIAENKPDDGGDIICSAPIEWESSMLRWRENAERIVTCVNAMEGLSNEEVTNLRTNFDQEKEKVAVAFAEWKDKNTHCIGFSVYNTPIFKINDRKNDIFSYQYSDLYRYFINNVYNQ